MNFIRVIFLFLISIIAAFLTFGCAEPLPPEQEAIINELNQRELPAWYDRAKFGIFIHWGPYAVPAFAPIDSDINDALANHYDDFFLHMPYVEWYWNALQFEGSATRQYHVENYGEGYSYDNFGQIFKGALSEWHPEEWANLFAAAGARYVVLVTKHHDGFLMWPSDHPNPKKPNWYSDRDIVGEMADAVRDRGMKFGIYYSGGVDWAWNPRSGRTLVDFTSALPIDAEFVPYVETHLRELITRYKPAVLWNDFSYPGNQGLWEMIRDYYEAVPEGVVNDRWSVLTPLAKRFQNSWLRDIFHGLLKFLIQLGGNNLSALQSTPPPHYDFRTLEYTNMEAIMAEKAEVTRGMGLGFGYNQIEPECVKLSEKELIHSLIDIVSKNGNLLLNVGPKMNGDIQDIERKRLEQVGAWLAINGTAIYASKPWIQAEGKTTSGNDIRFTQNEETVFAIILNDLISGPVRIINIIPDSLSSVELLGYGPVTWNLDETDIIVELPEEVIMRVAYTVALHK
ncbi:MAG: alpha-L-fucosidase [Deltaproteobacteria bacterium]|nr:alpha-L-fucosidase [Deltaproteobacteria bacterium]